MKKNFGKVAIVAMFVAIILFVLPSMVNANEASVAKIGGEEYSTLAEAVEAVPVDNTATTITLLRNVTDGTGFKVQPGQNIIIDFNNFSYDASNPLVGSAGTVTNGCQLLKGSTVKMQNGTLISTAAKILIQNYSNLTLNNMNISSQNASYVSSNNCGVVNIIGNTSITAKEGAYAFDMCWAPNKNYPEGTQITVDTTGTITGNIELGLWGDFSDTNGIKSTLNIKNVNHIGEFVIDPKLANQLTIEGGTFSKSIDNQYIKSAACTSVKVSDTEYKVGLKATALAMKESLEIKVGSDANLEASITPANAVEGLKYVSADTSIATVDSTGKVTAVKIGETEITATVGNVTKKCKVKVIAKDIVLELPQVDKVSEGVDLGISEETQKEINELLKQELLSNDEVKTAVQKALDEGKEVKVEIVVNKEKAAEISETDKEKIDKILQDEEQVAQYFDIDLVVTANGTEIGKITEPSEKITFSIALSDDMIKEGRTFYLVYVHNGETKKIETTLKDNKLSFSTDEFSTYALVYTDEVKDKTPQTGNFALICAEACVGVIVLAGVVAVKRRK